MERLPLILEKGKWTKTEHIWFKEITPGMFEVHLKVREKGQEIGPFTSSICNLQALYDEANRLADVQSE